MMKQKSIILALYMFLASIYYLSDESFRLVIFGLSLFIAFYMGVKREEGLFVLKIPKKVLAFFFSVFSIVVLIQVINGTFTPFVLYCFSSPLVAYFIYSNKFNTKILTIPLYIIASYVIIYYALNKTVIGALKNVSENYLSVILIMNIITIYMVKFRQKETITILPAFIGFFLSIMAIGRSGIVTSGFLLVLVLWLKWRHFSVLKKAVSFLALITPILAIMFLKWGAILNILENMSVFEKFTNGGLDSPSRDIIKEAYLSNINSFTFFVGYNYADNYWFQHYGLNPHNSYIRLHYFSGILFFVIILLLLMSLLKLVKKNIFFAGMLAVILIRSWTDSVIFLTLFDYVLVLLVLTALYNDRRTKDIN